jgi:hypothetical protein
MDCKTARLLLSLACPRATELDPAEAEALEAHVADCPECGRLAQAERQLDDRLGTAMRAVPVPVDLLSRLQSRLNKQAHWYRRHVRELVAVAALLLVGVAVGGWTWLGRQKSVVDVDVVSYQAVELLDARGSPTTVEQFIYDHYHLRTSVPRDLNYDYLRACSEELFQGRRIVRLLFVHNDDYAIVRILPDRQFDLPRLLNGPQLAGSAGITVALRPLSDPATAYLIEYASPSLDWLLIVEQPRAA